MKDTETTIKEVAKIIRDLVWTDTDTGDGEQGVYGINGAAEEVIQYFGYQPMETAPTDRLVDLLSNGAIRFNNCRFDPKRNLWVSLVRYMDDQNMPRSVTLHVKNPTAWFEIPVPPKFE